MHNNNMRIVFGTSFGLVNGYPIFDIAYHTNQCLVDSAVYLGEQVIGVLDQTNVFYIDPFHDGTQPFFDQTLPNFYNLVGGFDGLYLQDNHLPNQINGEIAQVIPPSKEEPQPKVALKSIPANEEDYGTIKPWLINKTQSETSTYYLPFLPAGTTLDELSMSMNGTEGGGLTKKIINLYVHNANAHRSLQKVKGALINNKVTNTTRPFLLSESSWSGSGAYGVGVITNLNRSWTDLQGLISQGLSLSMSGLGALMTDTCGSVGPMNEELCARWAQLAFFFPLARNYYNVSYLSWDGKWTPTPGSEPYNFNEFNWEFKYTGALNQRASFTRYIYSQLYSSYRLGGAVMRPLFFDEPTDNGAFDHVSDTYMLGDSIKVSPILTQGVKDGNTYQSYFTAGVWYDLNDYTQQVSLTQGALVNLKANSAYTNVHLKGGKIIPFIRNDQGKKTTRDLETGVKTSFIIGRDSSKSYADGNVYIDDGISPESVVFNVANEQYIMWKLRYAEKSINFWVDFGNFDYAPPQTYVAQYFREVMILDAVDLKDTTTACYLGTDLVPRPMVVDYNNDTQVLTIKPISDNVNLSFQQISIIRFVGPKDPNVCSSATYSYEV